ncbi:hypothetical protein [Anaerosporobacter sp.]
MDENIDKKLLVGVELLDYMSKLTDIAGELVSAVTTADEITNLLISEDSIYEGKAKEPMQYFASSLKANMDRLLLFYEKASQYVYVTYETMYQSDEALVAWFKKETE